MQADSCENPADFNRISFLHRVNSLCEFFIKILVKLFAFSPIYLDGSKTKMTNLTYKALFSNHLLPIGSTNLLTHLFIT